MQGAQIRGDGLRSFACPSTLCPTDCILRFTQDQNRYGATRAAFVPVCILFVEASVLTPQLARCGRLKKTPNRPKPGPPRRAPSPPPAALLLSTARRWNDCSG
jgi:hypothetical protein